MAIYQPKTRPYTTKLRVQTSFPARYGTAKYGKSYYGDTGKRYGDLIYKPKTSA